MYKRKEKNIYQTYKKIYGKEPNFGRENFMNLTIEIQAMAYVLFEYGVSIGEGGFCYEYVDLNMPMSMDIQDVIVEKLIGNNVDLKDDTLQFNDFVERTINIVGEAIRCTINHSQNRIETLRKISNILYVKKHVCPMANDVTIIKTAKCTEKDLRKVEQLIEFINQEKCKNNFNKYNAENVEKMVNDEILAPYGMHVNETGNGERPEITEESRRKLARELINGN